MSSSAAVLSDASRAPAFWARLGEFGDRPALLTDDGPISYGDLAGRVAELAAALGDTRRLVVVEGGNTVDTVVAYLAALTGRHPAILTPSADAMTGYDPDVVLRHGHLEERRPGTAHDLHPDLALLLSTSGSTGSPKLVRLSHTNLVSNAGAIASYLHIRDTDVAPTTLPLHYCYGLSVLNSHLGAGAAVLLTDESVASERFWRLFREHRATSLAGVPYTYQLLDRVGFAELHLPSLRYLTQAGGRLDPQAVRRYAELGQQRGFDFFVMYGQTEATARMAYLPPDLALTCPEAIGVPIPGGSFRVATDGELVYSGDNVMLGYARTPADLSRGRDLTELGTGDLGRMRPDGLLEITGRKSRLAKVFGLRIDLQRVEDAVARSGAQVHCADGGDRIVVALDMSATPVGDAELEAVREAAAAAASLPVSAVTVLARPGLPRLPSGKPDYSAIVAAAHADEQADEPADERAQGAAGDELPDSSVQGWDGPGELPGADELVALYADVLRRPVSSDDSFVSLRGDSLSYVEMSLRVERALGRLPAGWHALPIRDLAAAARRRGRGPTSRPSGSWRMRPWNRPSNRPSNRPWSRRWGGSVETSVVLRALAIIAIVGSHADLFMLMGGAHVLLAVAGFNFGRFFLTGAPRAERARHVVASTARIAVPCALWLALVWPLAADVTWRNVVLLNGVLGPPHWTDAWHYWFVEAVVYLLLAMALLVAVPWFDRAERRWPFGVPMVLVALGLLTRYDVVGLDRGVEIYRAHVVFWLFALGWAAVKATRHRQRLLVSVVAAVTMLGFFDDPLRVGIVAAGILLLVWVPSVRLPRLLTRPAGALAGASLAIYLTHWQVYPWLEDAGHSFLATVASLGVGTALWWLLGRLAAGPTEEMRDNLRWLKPRRYGRSDPWIAPAEPGVR